MSDDLAPGQVIADKYRVERVLGEGGMGYVIAAHHLKLDQRVALKFLKPEALKHQHVVERFAREARAAAKIRGEHVARVIDVGDLPNGAPYIVMEYLEGEDLAHRLHQRGPLPVEEAVSYLLQACEALAEAHAAGIVHRDLKPPNLFLARMAGRIPTLKVLDFGISKALDEDSGTGRNLTSTAMVMGTPHYMSPEQLRSSRDVDARSDIWALGVVLFELITGHPPFDGENATAVITAIVTEEPRPLFQLRADAPRELWPILLRCLAKPRAERYASVLELARALAPFSSDRARESLVRIESIVKPLHSMPPTADTEVSGPGLASTKVEPGEGSLSVPITVSASLAGAATETAPTLRSQEGNGGSSTGVSVAAVTGSAAETRATWNQTLAAAGTEPARRGAPVVWTAVAAVVVVGAVGYGLTAARGGDVASGTSTSLAPSASPAPSTLLKAEPAPTTAASEVTTPSPPASAGLGDAPAAPSAAAAPSVSASVGAALPTSAAAPLPRPQKSAKKPDTAKPDDGAAKAAAPATTTTGTTGSLRMGIK